MPSRASASNLGTLHTENVEIPLRLTDEEFPPNALALHSASPRPPRRARVQILAALAFNVFLVIVWIVYRAETSDARRQKKELAKYQ